MWSISPLPSLILQRSSFLLLVNLSIHVRLIFIDPCLRNLPTAWIILLFMASYPCFCFFTLTLPPSHQSHFLFRSMSLMPRVFSPLFLIFPTLSNFSHFVKIKLSLIWQHTASCSRCHINPDVTLIHTYSHTIKPFVCLCVMVMHVCVCCNEREHPFRTKAYGQWNMLSTCLPLWCCLTNWHISCTHIRYVSLWHALTYSNGLVML